MFSIYEVTKLSSRKPLLAVRGQSALSDFFAGCLDSTLKFISAPGIFLENWNWGATKYCPPHSLSLPSLSSHSPPFPYVSPSLEVDSL